MWLAWKTFRQWKPSTGPARDQEAGQSGARIGLAGHFRRGFLIQILNPKASVGWILIITAGVRPDSPWYAPLVIVLGCLVLGLCIFSAYVLLFSSRVLNREEVANSTGFRYALAAVYGLSGLWLIVDSLKSQPDATKKARTLSGSAPLIDESRRCASACGLSPSASSPAWTGAPRRS